MELATLGQIAGPAGLAVGATVLVFRSLIEKGLGGVPTRDRGRAVTTIALCASGIGVAGIAAWTFAGTSVVTHGSQSPAAVGGRDVIIGAPPTPSAANAPTVETPSAATPRSAGAHIKTQGAQSPAAVGGRDVTIGSPPTQPTTQPHRP